MKKSTVAPWWMGGPAMAGAAICVMVVVGLIAAYQSSGPVDVASMKTNANTTASQAEAKQVATSSGSGPAEARTADAPAVDTRAAETPAVGSAPEATSASVTITGCLERSDETFRLKDTTGANAPKSRSWKSGFLKKGSASIEVVDATKGLNLSNHVGQRVSVTGTLVDREMHGRSLQRVGASCTTHAQSDNLTRRAGSRV